MFFRRKLLVGMSLALLAGAAMAPAAGAAGGTLYVDGKNGSNTNSGLSWGSALKTIYAASSKVPREGAAAGWKVIVRGYTDYLYRERPAPGGYQRWGTASSPLVFQAEGWSPGASNYVKPRLSGALSAPRAGKSWTSLGGGVWSTPWPTKPAQFMPDKAYYAAVFQDDETPLWQRSSLKNLKSSSSTDKLGGYWWASGVLYVGTRGGLKPCAAGSTSTSCPRIEVPTNNGFYFDGAHGVAHVEVRGFEMRHYNVAIAFVGGTDHSAAYDNVIVGTSGAGIHVSGAKSNPAVGNRVERNVGRLNTIQAIKVNAGSHDTIVCNNSAFDNGLQGIKVQGPFDGGSDPRVTRDTLVCDNELHDQNFRRPNNSASYANGLTISDGALTTTVSGNRIWGNAIGINLAQQSSSGLAIDQTLIEDNLIWSNKTAGLSLNDGVKRRSAGSGRLTSRFNLYWANGIGITVSKGSTHKVSEHDTFHANKRFAARVGCKCSTVTAELRIEQGIVSGSGEYGVFGRSGGRATLAYVGLNGNGAANTKGKVTIDPSGSTNAMPPDFLSLNSSNADFLRIAQSSYQYTAGPSSSPIGARF